MEWHGPSIEVHKLGCREDGVDTLKMGGVWPGSNEEITESLPSEV